MSRFVLAIALFAAGCSDGNKPAPKKQTTQTRPARVDPDPPARRHSSHEHGHGAHPHARDAHHHHPHPHPHLDGVKGHHHPF